MSGITEEHDPLRPHSHEPNPTPPSLESTFTLELPNGRFQPITLADLQTLPITTVFPCYIISTGHGTSGPFAFAGVTLRDFIRVYWAAAWESVEVVSADGFGNRVMREEVEKGEEKRPILLAYTMNNQPLSRAQGAIRLIVPSETNDALRQVKWVGHICIRHQSPANSKVTEKVPLQ